MDIIVVLSSTPTSIVGVQFATFDGTAIAPGDYTSATRTIIFPVGVSSVTVTVDTIDDSISREGVEVFRAALSNTSNGLALGNQITATINIEDNDGMDRVFDYYSKKKKKKKKAS